MPTYPLLKIVNTSVDPANILTISPAPDCVTVSAELDELVAIFTILLKLHSPVIASSSAKTANSSELILSSLDALNACAAEVINLLGCIVSLLKVISR